MQRCPKCGVGKLFKSYLKPNKVCEHCYENIGGLNADDGPAWLTIGVVAIIVVPFLFVLESSGKLSYPMEMLIVLPTTILLALALLPRSKGFFIAALWLISRNPDRSS
ncbi:MAG: DUF983 domain-containing protein [Methylocystis sp.]